ncbi:MAG: M1 family metallopeptidase [Syntrophomonadaceae bacterium]|jgi:hypothetical protein|nr:M1 family metallopeptidase [Bacillota bacterium]NLP24604.1 M1 family metallopeptidase [Syntrophomonadaceae bacterium]
MKKKVWVIIIAAIIMCWAYFLGTVNQTGTEVAATSDYNGPDFSSPFPAPGKTLYRMSLYLDTDTRTLHGTTLLTTNNTSDQVLSELWFTIYADAFSRASTTPAPMSAYYAGFNSAGIEFDEILVNFKPVDYIKDDVSLQLMPTEDILPGQDITVEMQWKSQIPLLSYRYGYKDGVFMLGSFYPVLNVYDDQGWRTSYNSAFGDPFCFNCADFVVRLNIPEAYSMVSTGSIVEKIAEGNGRYFVTAAAENVRDFGLVVYDQYQEFTRTASGQTVSHYVPAGVSRDMGPILKETIDILDFFSCTWGSYPYPDFKVVFVPMKGFHGMEYSGLIFLSEDLLSPATDQQHTRFILAHEIAHQWWYGIVGNDQLREPWLDEGLANWGAYKYLHQQGMDMSGGKSASSPTNLSRELNEMYSRNDYYSTIYSGGESFWWGLEQELGEEKVKQVLRSYLANYRFQIATTEDLLQIIQQEAHYDMQEYFADWFSHENQQD